MLRYSLFFILIVLLQPADARMYQWVDPDSGRTQLSGTPPAWYRSGGENPRVFVFERGQLVDDTGITVEESRRKQLRQEALIKVEENAEAAKRKAEQSALMRSQLEKEPATPPAIPDLETATQAERDEAQNALEMPSEAQEAPVLSEGQIAELRSLISDWEARNQTRARELIGSGEVTDQEAASRETLRQFLEQNSDQ